MLVTCPPPIAPSLTPAYLRRVAETDVDDGFPKSQRGSSGMSEIRHDKGSMSMCAKPADKQQGMTHTSSHEDIVPRRSACMHQQESGRRRHRKRPLTPWAWRALAEKRIERARTSIHLSMGRADAWASSAETKLQRACKSRS